MIHEELFTEIMSNLKTQYEKDVERASVLSNIYGSDIDPVDNSLLTKSVFSLFETHFSLEQLSEISFFCYDQNFGLKANRTIKNLWDTILKMIKVNLD